MEGLEEELDRPPIAYHDCSVLDLAFVMDCTGSMGSYIDNARENIRGIVEEIVNAKQSDVRVALIEYRDHPPQDSSFVTRPHDFTSSVETMKGWLQNCQADGGGDTPEAVADALYQILKLTWRDEAARIVVLISDAPPHGLEERGDGFPKGCPSGHDPLKTCRDIAEMGITLYVAGCEPALERYKDFFVALSHVTGGQYIPLLDANLLAQLIVGGAKEEISLERWMPDVDEEVVAELQKGSNINDAELCFRVYQKLRQKGAKTDQLKLNEKSIANASPRAKSIAFSVDLSEAREKLFPDNSNDGYRGRRGRGGGPGRGGGRGRGRGGGRGRGRGHRGGRRRGRRDRRSRSRSPSPEKEDEDTTLEELDEVSPDRGGRGRGRGRGAGRADRSRSRSPCPCPCPTWGDEASETWGDEKADRSRSPSPTRGDEDPETSTRHLRGGRGRGRVTLSRGFGRGITGDSSGSPTTKTGDFEFRGGFGRGDRRWRSDSLEPERAAVDHKEATTSVDADDDWKESVTAEAELFTADDSATPDHVKGTESTGDKDRTDPVPLEAGLKTDDARTPDTDNATESKDDKDRTEYVPVKEERSKPDEKVTSDPEAEDSKVVNDNKEDVLVEAERLKADESIISDEKDADSKESAGVEEEHAKSDVVEATESKDDEEGVASSDEKSEESSIEECEPAVDEGWGDRGDLVDLSDPSLSYSSQGYETVEGDLTYEQVERMVQKSIMRNKALYSK